MSEQVKSQAKGVVAILTGPDGHVWANVSDFDRSGYGGFSMEEAQTIRAKQQLAFAFIQNTCSHVVVSAMGNYDCEQIVDTLLRTKGFRQTILPIGHEKEPA